MHYYGSLPETDLQWLREEATKQKQAKKSSRISAHKKKTKKLRTDLFILNACIIIINSNKQNDFLSILKAVSITPADKLKTLGRSCVIKRNLNSMFLMATNEREFPLINDSLKDKYTDYDGLNNFLPKNMP